MLHDGTLSSIRCGSFNATFSHELTSCVQFCVALLWFYCTHQVGLWFGFSFGSLRHILAALLVRARNAVRE